MIQNQDNNDYVSLVRIPSRWFQVFVGIFLTLVIANTLLELLTSWKWILLGETILIRTSVLMTLIVGWFFIVAHLWEVIMLGYAKMFRDRVYAEGRAEGKAEGIAEGKAEVYRQLMAWEQRRKEAEARGEKFTEPLPIPETQETKTE